MNDYYFVLKDTTHAFRISVDTILECLHLMEEQGAVPPIPDIWWEQIEAASIRK